MSDTITRLLALALVAAGSCSTLPDTSFPPERGFDVVATYPIDDARPIRVEIPASGDELTIFEVRTEPRSVERFDEEGRRYLQPVEEAAELRVFCRGRLYGQRRAGGEWFRPLSELFPGARQVEPRAGK